MIILVEALKVSAKSFGAGAMLAAAVYAASRGFRQEKERLEREKDA